MKKIFLSTLALLICFSAFGQGNLTFLYDNAGNCYMKYLTVVMSSPAKPNAEGEEAQPQTDILGTMKVTVYPNPTDGLLQVVIDGGNEQSFHFVLLDLNGKVLQNFTSHSLTNEVNLSGYAAGNYIFKLQSGDRQSVWQIIKK